MSTSNLKQIVSASAVALPNDSDVLSGAQTCHHKYDNHPGNKLFRDLIKTNQCAYQALSSRTMKSVMIEEIIRTVKKNNGGRFLHLDEASGEWSELSYRRVTDKIGHALRLKRGRSNNKKKAISTNKKKQQKVSVERVSPSRDQSQEQGETLNNSVYCVESRPTRQSRPPGIAADPTTIFTHLSPSDISSNCLKLEDASLTQQINQSGLGEMINIDSLCDDSAATTPTHVPRTSPARRVSSSSTDQGEEAMDGSDEDDEVVGWSCATHCSSSSSIFPTGILQEIVYDEGELMGSNIDFEMEELFLLEMGQ